MHYLSEEKNVTAAEKYRTKIWIDFLASDRDPFR